ncbi:MAG TPA: hypothetical protein VK163_13745 [Opitutaceae bacterium]|nr:hypothetical protein [Opitutaceae bacterium]
MTLFFPRNPRTSSGAAWSLALLIAAGTTLLAGCATTPPAAQAPTLAGNPALPSATISLFCSPEEWADLANRPYDGCVILRGAIDDSHHVTGPVVVDTYPDSSRTTLALRLAEKATISPTMVGTHVRPTARVYVLFYERDQKPRRAIIFAEQTGNAAATRSASDQSRQLIISYY